MALTDISICNKPNIFCNESTYVATTFYADIYCNGGNNDGGWEYKNLINNIGTQQCWSNLDICFDEDMSVCLNYNKNDEDTPTASVFYQSISPTSTLKEENNFSHCAADNAGTYKEYCIWNNDYADDNDTTTEPWAKTQSSPLSWRQTTAAGIDEGGSPLRSTGHTGDDMFRILPDDSFILEYVDIDGSDEDGLRLITRHATTYRDLMIPAGPRFTQSDYRDFINSNHSSLGISAVNACFPAQASFGCDTTSIEPVGIDAFCGTADGQNIYINGTNVEPSSLSLCGLGEPTNIVNTSGTYNWSCKGYGAGANDSCSAVQLPPETGICGTATKSYNLIADYDDSYLCTSGTPSSPKYYERGGGADGSCGGQRWTCSGAYGGSSKICETNCM